MKNLVVDRGFNSAARSSSLGCGWRDAEDQGWFQCSSVSQVYFHERLHEWDYFKCPNQIDMAPPVTVPAFFFKL